MAILITNDGDKIVSNIAARNALTKKFDGMVVTVEDAIADITVGGGQATYQWNATQSRWMLTWKENVDNLTFITEELVIAGGQVVLQEIPQDGLIWDATIQDGAGLILYDVRPDVIGKVIDLGTVEFDGNTLVFTYAYGVVQAAIAAINNALDMSVNTIVTGSPTNMTGVVMADGLVLTARPLLTSDISDFTGGQVSTADLALKSDINNPTFTGTVSGITKSMVGLGNVDNTTDANKPVSTATQTVLDLKADLVNGKVQTSQMPDSILGQLEYQGVWDFATALPTATSANKGYYYVASNSSLANGYIIGDWAVSNGTSWDKIDNTDAVQTVAGRTGAVVLGISDITNLQTNLDLKAALASPTFTGVPVAPTAAAGTSTTQIATTAFVVANAAPLSITVSTNTTLAATDNGKRVRVTANVTVPTTVFADGNSVLLYNDSAASITITMTGFTAYLDGVNTARTSFTLATRGTCAIMFNSATNAVLMGKSVS